MGEAYKVLTDPQTRAAYDEIGADFKAGQEFHAPPGSNQGFETSGHGCTDAEAQQQSDFFESLFGRSGRAGGMGGGGGGVGGGDGEHQIEFVIPRGVQAGQRNRLAGQGAPGTGKGAAGDLYLEVGFRAHSDYRVEQHDVYLGLPVALWEAALGAEIEVPTPSGAVELKIPAGSNAGLKLRLKGRGIPGAKAGTPAGDVYFVLQIVVPPAQSEPQQAACRELAARFPAFKPRASLGDITDPW